MLPLPPADQGHIPWASLALVGSCSQACCRRARQWRWGWCRPAGHRKRSCLLHRGFGDRCRDIRQGTMHAVICLSSNCLASWSKFKKNKQPGRDCIISSRLSSLCFTTLCRKSVPQSCCFNLSFNPSFSTRGIFTDYNTLLYHPYNRIRGWKNHHMLEKALWSKKKPPFKGYKYIWSESGQLCQKMSLPCCRPPDLSWMLLMKNCGSWHRAITTQEQHVPHHDFNVTESHSIQVEPSVGRWEGEMFPVDKLTDLFGFVIHCLTSMIHSHFWYSTKNKTLEIILQWWLWNVGSAHRLAECTEREQLPSKKMCPAACYEHLTQIFYFSRTFCLWKECSSTLVLTLALFSIEDWKLNLLLHSAHWANPLQD